MDSHVQVLPASVAINGNDQKQVYFVEQQGGAKTLNVTFSNVYDSVALEHKGKTVYDKYYAGKNKKATFTLSQAGTFDAGLNKYTVRGRQKGKKVTISTIDIYNIIPVNTGT